MAIEVKKISDLNEVDVSRLIQESEKEGYRFVSRLASEYEDGTNRFSEQGEALFGAWDGEELVAIGGLNRNTKSKDASAARLQRAYTLPSYRRKGIGSELFNALFVHARGQFNEITTKTESAKADAFYRANGFQFDERSPDITHVYSL
ncbi:GNAT family N-acetyltransferase [Psychrobacillus lasiicapitis]|uniref:GNAT family N-acetyltransferase n=1 Tax=Psychrobacillus lasiicapitis TaxID=1636719 RepID=A0A544T6F5_9BACI|nr:GNAT family N-acetyltransferase [Psychrobacillus lasiicapitis]TQR13036.1 GNAT family N-acetyltransferase [Psychrobacillus lasiicapitis]GGA34999.1 N-acetyltransferase [Psychrobacillus lasiicapitis]